MDINCNELVKRKKNSTLYILNEFIKILLNDFVFQNID